VKKGLLDKEMETKRIKLNKDIEIHVKQVKDF